MTNHSKNHFIDVTKSFQWCHSKIISITSQQNHFNDVIVKSFQWSHKIISMTSQQNHLNDDTAKSLQWSHEIISMTSQQNHFNEVTKSFQWQRNKIISTTRVTLPTSSSSSTTLFNIIDAPLCKTVQIDSPPFCSQCVSIFSKCTAALYAWTDARYGGRPFPPPKESWPLFNLWSVWVVFEGGGVTVPLRKLNLASSSVIWFEYWLHWLNGLA